VIQEGKDRKEKTNQLFFRNVPIQRHHPILLLISDVLPILLSTLLCYFLCFRLQELLKTEPKNSKTLSKDDDPISIRKKNEIRKSQYGKIKSDVVIPLLRNVFSKRFLHLDLKQQIQ
jgi:hypothetical protein